MNSKQFKAYLKEVTEVVKSFIPITTSNNSIFCNNQSDTVFYRLVNCTPINLFVLVICFFSNYYSVNCMYDANNFQKIGGMKNECCPI